MRANNNKLGTFPPVTRRDLIDAISKLHVINDCPSQIGMGVNNLENRCCSQLTKRELNNCQCYVCGSRRDLTKCIFRQVMDDNKE